MPKRRLSAISRSCASRTVFAQTISVADKERSRYNAGETWRLLVENCFRPESVLKVWTGGVSGLFAGGGFELGARDDLELSADSDLELGAGDDLDLDIRDAIEPGTAGVFDPNACRGFDLNAAGGFKLGTGGDFKFDAGGGLRIVNRLSTSESTMSSSQNVMNRVRAFSKPFGCVEWKWIMR